MYLDPVENYKLVQPGLWSVDTSQIGSMLFNQQLKLVSQCGFDPGGGCAVQPVGGIGWPIESSCFS